MGGLEGLGYGGVKSLRNHINLVEPDLDRITIQDEKVVELRFREPNPEILKSLDTSELESIDLEMANRLAKLPWFIDLSYLKSIDEEIAKALAEHEGSICLTGLESVTEAVASALTKHKGPVILNTTRLPENIQSLWKNAGR